MSAGPKLSWPQRLTVAAIFAIVVAFYFWTAASSGFSSTPDRNLQGYYSLLAASFRAGQLNLLIDPHPALLALQDPYDADQNQGLRLHDAILFNGKYYLYYGPAPAVLFFLPFRALTGLNLPEPPVVAFFCSAALLSAFLLVRFLCRTYVPETPFWLLAMTIPALAFGTAYPLLLRRPIHYEVPIAIAHTFVLTSFYCFVVATAGERLRRGYVALGSLLWGLALASRFTMLIAGVVPAILIGHAMIRQRHEPVREHLRTALTLAIPAGACLFLLGLYNYLRFDSWTQFGLRYTLHGWISARVYQFVDVARVPWGLFYYMLAPPQLTGEFPFVHLSSIHYLLPPNPQYFLERRIGGLLPDAPFTLILMFAPALFVLYHRACRTLCLFAAGSMIFGLALLFLYSSWAGIMRYEVDFAIFLLVPALLLWSLAINALPTPGWRRTLAISAFVILVGITVVFNAAFSVVGSYNTLKVANPQTYEAIHSFFRPLEDVFASI